MANSLCHFEFLVSDVTKAKEFYGKVFGSWKFEETPAPEGGTPYTMIRPGEAPDGGMMKKPDQAPVHALNVYFLVDDVNATLEKVSQAGGQVIIGKTDLPGMGAWAMFLDPDGIPAGIYETQK